MENFKFDFNVNRDVTMSHFDVRNSENERPDVAVIFKTPMTSGGFSYSGSISLSLLDKLFTEPTYKVGIIDKMFLLNCPDPILSEALDRFTYFSEVDCNFVRTNPHRCTNGFSLCGCKATGEEIFPSNIEVKKVPLTSVSSLELPIKLYSRLPELHSSERCELIVHEPLTKCYYIEDRKDLVYFISDTDTVQIYYPENISLPDSIDSKASIISSEESWVYISANHDFRIEDLTPPRPVSSEFTDKFALTEKFQAYNVEALITPFVYDKTSFSVQAFYNLLVDLLDG